MINEEYFGIYARSRGILKNGEVQEKRGWQERRRGRERNQKQQNDNKILGAITPRFRDDGQDNAKKRQGSRPKLEYLMHTNSTKNNGYKSTQRLVHYSTSQTNDNTLYKADRQKDMKAKHEISTEIRQKNREIVKASNRKNQNVGNQYSRGEYGQVFGSKQIQRGFSPVKEVKSDKDGKKWQEVTFSAESTEPESDQKEVKITEYAVIEDYLPFQSPYKTKQTSTSFLPAFRKRLLQKQIQQKQSIYRHLIRSSSRQSNTSHRSKLKQKMSQLLSQLHTLNKLSLQ